MEDSKKSLAKEPQTMTEAIEYLDTIAGSSKEVMGSMNDVVSMLDCTYGRIKEFVEDERMGKPVMEAPTQLTMVQQIVSLANAIQDNLNHIGQNIGQTKNVLR